MHQLADTRAPAGQGFLASPASFRTKPGRQPLDPCRALQDRALSCDSIHRQLWAGGGAEAWSLPSAWVVLASTPPWGSPGARIDAGPSCLAVPHACGAGLGLTDYTRASARPRWQGLGSLWLPQGIAWLETGSRRERRHGVGHL